jgi:DNA polymerase I
MQLSTSEKSKLFSIFENLKAEKKEIEEKGYSASTRKEVLLVDGYNTFIRCFAAIPTLNEDGLHTGGMSGFLKSMGAAIKMLKPDRCVVVFDGVGGSMKRRKIFPDYKAHKKTKIRLNRIYDENTSLGDEDISMKKQLQRLVIYLQELPVNMLSLDNVEADDTIAHLALDYFKDWKVYIMSSDKDFLQLVDDRVNVWSPTKKHLYAQQDVINEYGLSPQNLVYFRTLDGDDSDNIPGIRGCGLKTVLKAFPFLNGDRTDLKKIKEHAEVNRDKLKVYENIVTNWQDVERNYELMQLTETQLQTFAQLNIKDILDVKKPKLNRFQLAKLMTEDKLWNAIPNYQNWVTEVFQKLDNHIL